MTLISEPVRTELVSAYTAPDRHYHDLHHIEALLCLADDCADAITDRDAVEAMVVAGKIDQPLHHVHHFGAAGAAIGPGRRRVGHDRSGADIGRRHAVDRGHDLGALLQGRAIRGVGAGIADVRAAQREEIASPVEREFCRDGKIAALVIGEERLVSVGGPLDRPREAPRRPRDQREFGIDHAARAEIPIPGVCGA